MKTKSYQAKLKDPRWQRTCLHVFESVGWKCEDCGASDLPLHIHQCAYIKGFEPWQYDNDLLMVLCEKHYKIRQRMDERIRYAIGRIMRRTPLSKLAEFLFSAQSEAQRLERK